MIAPPGDAEPLNLFYLNRIFLLQLKEVTDNSWEATASTYWPWREI